MVNAALVRTGASQESRDGRGSARGRPAEGGRAVQYWKLRFLTVALPALLAGSFGFVRQWLESSNHLPDAAGNLITALLALAGGLVYFQTAYALAARLAAEARRAEAERQTLVQRQALADDLHDSIAQTLFFLNVRLKRAVEQSRAMGAADLVGLLAEATAANEHAYGELRQTIDQLAQPQALQARRSVPVADLAARELTGTGVSVSVEAMQGEPRLLDPSACREVYAILAEALCNVRKHARARGVRVWMTEVDSGGRAGVADDGRGFRVGGASGYGLAAARRRAAAAGLGFVVRSAPGHGTRVEVTWGVQEGGAAAGVSDFDRR